jgi:hypothetical protein
MLTLFTTAKPFLGHIKVIQRNALKSWKLLHPDVEVILFGNDEGAAEVCQELDLRHVPEVKRSRAGSVRADSLFSLAQQIARHEVLCYANCDIVFMQDFPIACERVRQKLPQFLVVGRRTDTDITEPIDFSLQNWQQSLAQRAQRTGTLRFFHNIDYFAFSRGLYQQMPEIVVGRVYWDHWMLWKAMHSDCAVVDVSQSVCAVHQNHDYSHVPEGWKSVSTDEDAQRNFLLAGGRAHLRTIEDAPYRLTPSGIEKNSYYWLAPTKRTWRSASKTIRGAFRTGLWHPFLNATRSRRHAVGLKKDPRSAPTGPRKHWMDQ